MVRIPNIQHRSFRLAIRCTFAYLLFLVLLPAQLTWANANDSVSLGRVISIESQVLGEQREVVVHTPADYSLTKDIYPVIYLLDGEHNLLYTAGIIDYLKKNQFMPDVILVAINNVDRVRDFTPTPSKEGLYGMPQMGGADKFLSFIETELKPELAKAYRIAPYSVLLGHSYGGILSIYSQQVRPSLFNAHIAISPSIFYDDRALIESARKMFDKGEQPAGFLYMSVANEYQEFADSIQEYVNVIAQHQSKTLRWKFDTFTDETHMSTLHPSTYNGLKLLFKDWYVKDVTALLKGGNLDDVEAYYTDLSEEFGYQIQVPKETLTAMGYFLMSNKRVDEAINTFKLGVDRYPRSGAAHFHLAQAYKAKKNTKLANELIRKACQIATKEKELGTAMFCDQAKSLKTME